MATPRPMALAQPSFAPVDAEAVKVGWSAEMRFPRTIRVPVWVSNGVWGRGNGRREIVIKSADEPLHPLLVTFLHMMPAYRGWIAEMPQQVVGQSEPQTDPPVEGEPEAPDLTGEPFDMTLKTGEATDEPRQQQGEIIVIEDNEPHEAVLVERGEAKPRRRKKK